MDNQDLIEEIVPRKKRVVPDAGLFEKKDIGKKQGKGSVYLKEVYIPMLQSRLYDMTQKYKEAIAKKNAVKAGKQVIIRNARNRVWNKKKKQYAITEKKLNQRAQEWYFDKVKLQRLQFCTMLDGITAYPVLQAWSRTEKLPYKHLSLFILINHFEWFQLKDAEYYGFSYKVTSKYVKQLVEWGWVEKFVGRRAAFVASIKGQNKFREMMRFYNKKTKELLKKYDAKFSGRSGGTSVKVRRKFISRVKNIYEDEPTKSK